MAELLCTWCHESVVNRRRYTWASREEQHIEIAQIVIQEILEQQAQPTEYICRPCWQRAERTYHRNIREARQEDDAADVHSAEPVASGEPVQMTLPGYVRTPDTRRTCVFQHCENSTRYQIPNNIVLRMLGRYNLLISENSRVCNEHLQEDLWHVLAVQQNNISEFTAAHIARALSILTRHVTTDVLNFVQYQTISPNEFHTWTGLTHDQYTDLLSNTPSLNDRRNKNVILAAVLVKLRTGDSNARLATIFRTSESSFARMLKTGRIALMQDFVPLHLGFDHLSREDVARRNLTVPDNLFGNPDSPSNERKAITIFDGTYIYIQKSSNYFFQRKSYSNHKYRNLLKPFLFVCCDGHIIEVSGPHAATTSDAQVMNSVIDNEEDSGDGVFHWFYRNGDVFILDRGFRDSVVPMQQHGYSVHMPESKHPNETQLTTDQANKSRLITICRWVVEVVNGRFKRDFRLLRNIYINRTLYYMFEFFKIAAALINAYHRLIDDNIHAQTFLNIINERLTLTNILADIVIRHNYNRRRVQFRSLSADVPELNDFPRLTEEDLVLFSLGIYQIKQARSYYGEHLNPNGEFIIEIGSGLLTDHARELGENVIIIRGRIQSRHVRARTYYVYIGWNTRLSGREAIGHYYCTCNVGKRTVARRLLLSHNVFGMVYELRKTRTSFKSTRNRVRKCYNKVY